MIFINNNCFFGLEYFWNLHLHKQKHKQTTMIINARQTNLFFP